MIKYVHFSHSRLIRLEVSQEIYLQSLLHLHQHRLFVHNYTLPKTCSPWQAFGLDLLKIPVKLVNAQDRLRAGAGAYQRQHEQIQCLDRLLKPTRNQQSLCLYSTAAPFSRSPDIPQASKRLGNSSTSIELCGGDHVPPGDSPRRRENAASRRLSFRRHQLAILRRHHEGPAWQKLHTYCSSPSGIAFGSATTPCLNLRAASSHSQGAKMSESDRTFMIYSASFSKSEYDEPRNEDGCSGPLDSDNEIMAETNDDEDHGDDDKKYEHGGDERPSKRQKIATTHHYTGPATGVFFGRGPAQRTCSPLSSVEDEPVPGKVEISVMP